MDKIKEYMKNLGISQKFVLSLMIFLVVPMIVLFVIVNISVKTEMDAATCKTNLEILKQTESGIRNFVNDIKTVSLDVATDQDVQELIRLYNRGAASEEKEKQRIDVQFQVQMKLEQRDIRNLSIFNESDIIYQYGDFVQKEDRQFIPQLDELNGRPLWTGINEGVYINYHLDYDKIYMLRAIKDMYTYKIIAYERIVIDELFLREQYVGILDNGSSLVIVGQDGKILSASDPVVLGKTEEDIGIKGGPNHKEGYYIDEGVVVSWYYLAEPGWKIIKIDPASRLFRNNGIQSGIIMACIMFIFIFGIAFMAIQRKSMITPIVKLSQEAKNFKKENFKMPVFIDSRDEIGELNRNLSQMMDYIQDLIINQYQAQIKHREMELKYMQSQINPHFLYNTLDSIRWMAVIEGQDKIAEQVEALSDVFRHVLSGGKEIVELKQEIQHLKSYILIQKKRFGDRIHFDMQIQEGLEECQVLKLILQPLVENSIVHGLENKPEGGTIWIRVKSMGNNLLYCVEDDGVGADEGKIYHSLTGQEEVYNVFALKNINERVRMKYGREYGLEFHSKLMEGTVVKVRLPKILKIKE